MSFEVNTSKTNITTTNIKEKQEGIRWNLAIGFSIWYGCLIFMFIYIIIFKDISVEQSNLLTVLLSWTTWFVWTILWFYFWQNSN